MSDAETPTRSLAEIGRDAARKAQREALLATLEACGWRLTEAAEVRGLGTGTGNIIRAIRTLGLSAEYAEARASGKVKRGAASHRQPIASPLTHSEQCGTVGA